MNEVLQKVKISEEAQLLKLRAPETANRAKPGQYILLKTGPSSPGLPYLIAGVERTALSIVIPTKGEEVKQLDNLRKGKHVTLTGPLGKHIVPDQYGNIAIISNALTVGAACWIARSLRGGDNKIFLIASSKGKFSRSMEEGIKESADKTFLVNDGPSRMGDPLVNEVHNLMRKKHINLTFTLVDLMHSHLLARITNLRSKTYSFLTPIIDDGLGICGKCRVIFDGETKLACIEGPAMDAHKIDWETLLIRHGYPLTSTEA